MWHLCTPTTPKDFKAQFWLRHDSSQSLLIWHVSTSLISITSQRLISPVVLALTELQYNQQRWKVQKMWTESSFLKSLDPSLRLVSCLHEITCSVKLSHNRITSVELCRVAANSICCCICQTKLIISSWCQQYIFWKQCRHEDTRWGLLSQKQ